MQGRRLFGKQSVSGTGGDPPRRQCKPRWRLGVLRKWDPRLLRVIVCILFLAAHTWLHNLYQDWAEETIVALFGFIFLLRGEEL